MNKSQRSSKSPKKFRSNSLFPVMSTIPEGSSPTSKISNFFRRHRKSTNFSTEDENEVMSSSEMGGDVGGSNENLEKVNKKKEEFGNYNTVSGTGANLLRDVFNKKYRSSMKPSKSKLKKESIKEEESSEASNTLTASVGKKLHHDMHRSRHTSISYDSKRSFMPSIRGIFESFRSRSNRDSFSDVNQSANNSSTSPTSNPIPHTIVYAPGKKKKKFKVCCLALWVVVMIHIPTHSSSYHHHTTLPLIPPSSKPPPLQLAHPHHNKLLEPSATFFPPCSTQPIPPFTTTPIQTLLPPTRSLGP